MVIELNIVIWKTDHRIGWNNSYDSEGKMEKVKQETYSQYKSERQGCSSNKKYSAA